MVYVILVERSALW